MMKNKPRAPRGTMRRILAALIRFYPVLVPMTALLIIFSAVVAAIPALFMKKIFELIGLWQVSGDFAAASAEILPRVLLLAALYGISMVSVTAYNQLMVSITQGFLHKLRVRMFSGMQDLPIRYFDTHKHGEIMSRYTNDVDTLRELVSRSLPALLQSCTIILTVLFIMI